MKKILLAILVLALSLVGFACTGTDDSSKDSTTPDNPALINAMAQVVTRYGSMPEKTGSSFDLVKSVVGNEIKFDVEWTLEGENLGEAVKIVEETDKDGNVTLVLKIDVLAAQSDVNYILRATIKAENGDTLTQEFKHIVPRLLKSTHAQYMAAKKGNLLWVEGTVIALNSKANGNKRNHVYFADEDGAYYAYGGDQDPVADLGISVGMKVKVIGTKDVYNGTHEVKDYTVEVLSTEVNPVAPRDLTELVTNAESLTNNDDLMAHQSDLVVIKNVLVHTLDDGNMTFKVGNNKSYYRISGSSSFLTEAEETKLKADHEANFGKVADVQGIVTFYDGVFYLAPVSGEFFANAKLPERTAEEKVALEQEAIVLPTDITEYTIIDVPATGKAYNDVVISWTSDNTDLVSFANGQMTIKLGGVETEVKVTATFEIPASETRSTKEFTLKLAADKVFNAEYVTTPEVDKDFAFAMEQKNLDKTLYFNGELKNGRLQTTDNASLAVKIRLEAVEGNKYRMYFMDNDVKKYIEIKVAMGDRFPSGKVYLNETPTDGILYDFVGDTLNSFTTTQLQDDGTPFSNSFFFGTNGTYTDISAKSDFSITGDKVTDIDKSQFIARLANIVEDKSTPAEKVACEKGKIVMPTEEVTKDTELKLPSQGKKFKDVLITWTVNGTVAIDSYKIVLGDKAQVLTVVGTFDCGADVTETVEYTINVGVKVPVVDFMVVGQEYYMTITSNNKTEYATKVNGKSMDRTADIAQASKFVLVDAGNGEFYLKNVSNGLYANCSTSKNQFNASINEANKANATKFKKDFDNKTLYFGTDSEKRYIYLNKSANYLRPYADKTGNDGYVNIAFQAVAK